MAKLINNYHDFNTLKKGMTGILVNKFSERLLKFTLSMLLFASLSACETINESRQTYFSGQNETTQSQTPAAHSPLWKRIRNNFELTSKKAKAVKDPRADQQVQKHVKHFRKNDKTINTLSKQATPYLFYVVEQLEKRNMPGELALLPMIESAYQPHVTSNKGAAGLWQFIPSTGRLYGLKQNSTYDGRRDVKASTQAALNYLEFLHKEFNKDWMLALAAYNAGEGAVHRAIKRNIRDGKPITFWDLNLPKETREYIPKFLALAHIIANPEKHEVSLPHIDNKPYFIPVNPGSTLSFHQVAKFADIPVNELKRLNSGYGSSTHPRGGPKELLLPVANAKKFEIHFPKDR